MPTVTTGNITNCTYLALNEFTDNFVVEIINWGPLDSLLNILFLLSFQCQFNEDLLKLLINKINTKLFKSIFLKYIRITIMSKPLKCWHKLYTWQLGASS